MRGWTWDDSGMPTWFPRCTALRGFTLIEMLVVIAIMGILASIAFVGYNEAKAQSRDRQRMAQMEQLKVALEQYKDKYGRYPAAGCGANPAGVVGGNWWAGPGPLTAASDVWGVVCDDYIAPPLTNPSARFVPEFIEELPRDPSREDIVDRGYFYTATADGLSYKLIAHFSVENLFAVDYSHPYARCPHACLAGPVCGSPTSGAFPGSLQRETYAIFRGPDSVCF